MLKLCALFHRGDKHKGTRIFHGIFRARDGDLAVFERLTQHFEGGLIELRQFTQMEILVPFSRFSEMPIYRGFVDM